MKNTKKTKKNKKTTKLCIVKRKGHCEIYDDKKVYGSCYFACRSSHLNEKESESISNKVCKSVNKWVKSKKEVSSNTIFRHITKELKKYNKDAAFMYETHRDIS